MPRKASARVNTEAERAAQPVEETGGRQRKRLEAIKQTAGLLSGVYGRDDLERLREDWPT